MSIKFNVDEEQKELDKQYQVAVDSGDVNAKRKIASRHDGKIIARTPLEKVKKVFFIISIIAFIALAAMSLAPVITGFLGIVVFLVWLLFVIFASIFSLGLAWINAGFRSFNDGFINAWRTMLEAPDKIIDATKKLIPYFAGACGAIILVALVLSIICFAKHKKGNTLTFVFALIFAVASVLLIIIGISLANGTK